MTLYHILAHPKDATPDMDDWANAGLFPQRSMFPPPAMPPMYAPQQPQGVLHQAQLAMLAVSRQSAPPHQRARAAAALSRSSGSIHSGTLFDPNAPPTSSNTPSSANTPSSMPWTIIDIGGMSIKNVSPSVFGYSFLTMLYLNHNNLTHIPIEVRRLRHLILLDLSGNKLSRIPSELGLLTSLQRLFLFDNNIDVLPWELGNLFKLEHLGIEGNPIVEPIMSMMQKEGTPAVITYMRDHSPVANPPAEREWVILESDPPLGASETCSVFCYNTLCEKYASPKTYGYTPSWALAWEYRRDAILQEILLYSADIVCLQEIEAGQYESFFKGQLRELGGYDSIFWCKSRARTMNEQERRSVDGCATFFRMSKYSLVEKHLVEFNQIALQRPDFKKTEDVYNRLMNKDNIAVISLLKNKESGAHLLIANCHIHWDPTYKDVKLVQVAMLMESLEKMHLKYLKELNLNSPSTGTTSPAAESRKMAGKLPLFICGDFNSTLSSGVSELLCNGRVSQGHEDFGSFSYGNYTKEGLAHSFSLKSAYKDAKLAFTNFTPTFREMIDHIWYAHNLMSVIGVLGGVEKSYVDKCVGFPNAHFPSDHIPILAEFRIISPPGTPSSSHPAPSLPRFHIQQSKKQ